MGKYFSFFSVVYRAYFKNFLVDLFIIIIFSFVGGVAFYFFENKELFWFSVAFFFGALLLFSLIFNLVFMNVINSFLLLFMVKKWETDQSVIKEAVIKYRLTANSLFVTWNKKRFDCWLEESKSKNKT